MKKILSLLLVSSFISAMEPMWDMTAYEPSSSTKIKYIKEKKIDECSVFIPHQLKPVDLFYSKKVFSVLKDNKKHEVKKYLMDVELRNIKKKHLISFLENGSLALNLTDNGEYTLKANGHIIGGGPIFGAIMYSVTKATCYAIATTAIGSIVTATAGTAILAATGTLAAAGGLALGSTIAVPTAISTTVGVISGGAATGAAVASGAVLLTPIITVTVGTANAATMTVGIVTSVGSIAGAVMAVETMSMAVGTFCGLLPTP